MGKLKKDRFRPTEIRICEDDEAPDIVIEECQRPPKIICDGISDFENNVRADPRVREAGDKNGSYVDPSVKQRTGMGDYIVPEGGVPLTRQAQMLVGPANYSLPSVDLTKLKKPEWSILNRNIFNPEGFKRPPPNAYTLPEELIKKDKRFIFHKRLKANKRVIAGPCKVGPTYNVTNYNVGKDSLQWTFTKGQRNKIVAGPFNSLLTPADYPGFKTPCAELYEEDGVLPHPFHANFTSIPKTRYPDIPGPGTYTIRDPDSGLSKSFGMAPNQDFSTEIPAPNEYDVESKIGKDCPAFSITLPLKKQPLPFRVPSPGAYMIERKFEHKEKIIMACRVPSPVLVKMPDPATYTIKGDTDKPKPCPSLKSRTRCSYPSYSWGPEGSMGRSPGPASRNIGGDLAHKDKGVTLKIRLANKSDGARPGPADHGRVDIDPLSNMSRPPAYSMRAPYKAMTPGPNPGPAAYQTVNQDSGKGITLKGRHPIRAKQCIPAPNAYIPKQGCTRAGAECGLGPSLRSRHSPWVYSGLKRML